MSQLVALRRIVEHYEARSELYTSDTDLAFGMFQIASTAIAAAAREGGDAKQAPGKAPQSGAESASPDPRRIA